MSPPERETQMTKLLAVLGAQDPEMNEIEKLFRAAGVPVVYAMRDGKRVHPGNAYQAQVDPTPFDQTGTVHVYCVECSVDPAACAEAAGGWGYDPEIVIHTIDHHRPGDPGFGRPPAEFLDASSLGQVIALLTREELLYDWREGPDESQWVGLIGEDGGPLIDWEDRVDDVPAPFWMSCEGEWIVNTGEGPTNESDYTLIVPQDLVLAAAADHCLSAAYRGECPGVDPDALMQWRAESRAKFQGRPVAEVLLDIERAKAEIQSAPIAFAIVGQIDGSFASDTLTVGRPVMSRLASHYRGEHARPGHWWANKTLVRDLRRPLIPGGATGCDESHGYDSTAPSHYPGTYAPPIPELPEAQARLGESVLTGPMIGPDGRRKYNLMGAPEACRAFLEQWAPNNGLVDGYGDPERGIVGGYLPQ